MNILPKKRWHVRTKDNIARVRKDEAAAREEECKKREKLELAESEARVNFLRKRSGLPENRNEKNTGKDAAQDIPCASQHVNLFSDYKKHVKASNKELEKEKKDEQEKYEKQIGYLTYLGQNTNEALRVKSWYETAPNRLTVGYAKLEINEKDIKTKLNHDPLTLINAILPPDPKPDAKSTLKRKRSPSRQLERREADLSKLSKSHKERKRHKKDKREKRSKKHKHKEKNVMDDQIQMRLKIEKLRKDRLRRESTERARQEELLAPKESRKSSEVTNTSTHKIVQKYNSQFNPELAKQNIN